MLPILVAVFMVCSFSLFIINIIEDDYTNAILALFVIVCGLWGMAEGDRQSYKNGQIDALNGEYKYEMEIKQDTTYYELD